MAVNNTLTTDSPGIRRYLSAQSQKEEGDRASCVGQFLETTEQLNNEISKAKPDSPERRELLEALLSCYQFLYTESILPDNSRILNPKRVKPEELSRLYTKGMLSIEEELANGYTRNLLH